MKFLREKWKLVSCIIHCIELKNCCTLWEFSIAHCVRTIITNCTCVHIVLFCCSSLVKFTFVLWWEVRVSTVYLLFTVGLYYTCINLDSPMSLDVTTWMQINTNTSCLMWFGRIIAALWCCRKCSESEDVDLVLISQKTYRHLELVTILWCWNECLTLLYKTFVNHLEKQ